MSADSRQTGHLPRGPSGDADNSGARPREARVQQHHEMSRTVSECMDANRQSESRLGEPASDPGPALTEREIAEIEERAREHRQYWDEVYQSLKFDAQSCARSMRFSPLFGNPEEWHEIVGRSLDDYRSGRSLMAHLGVDRLIDPALTGMLLAIRRGLIEEVGATSMADYVLVDMVVIAFANTMRIQSMIGNTALGDVLSAYTAGTLEEGLRLPSRGHPRARRR
jgi:hypothetical protein